MKILTNIASGLILIVMSALFSGCSNKEIHAQSEKLNDEWNQIIINYQKRSDLFNQILEEIFDHPDIDNGLLQAAIESNKAFILIQSQEDIHQSNAALAEFAQTENRASDDISQVLVSLKKINYDQSELLIDISDDIYKTEHEISKQKLHYVNEVKQYNSKLHTFPINLLNIIDTIHEIPYLPLLNESGTLPLTRKKISLL